MLLIKSKKSDIKKVKKIRKESKKNYDNLPTDDKEYLLLKIRENENR